jgi:hypothetical protein
LSSFRTKQPADRTCQDCGLGFWNWIDKEAHLLEYSHERHNTVESPAILPSRPAYEAQRIKTRPKLGDDCGFWFKNNADMDHHQELLNHGRFNTPEHRKYEPGPPRQVKRERDEDSEVEGELNKMQCL